MDNDWIKLDIFTTTAGADPVCAALTELGINGFQITDPNDLDDFLNRKSGYWDYYDDSILNLKYAETTVTVYISDNVQGAERLSAIKQELTRLSNIDAEHEWGRLEYAVSGVREEDWALAWKKYYHPAKLGERLVVCPSWESYEARANEVVLRLDPGMAFGTGTHESTMLCIRLLERHMPKNARVLDLGCGSGILAISAVLLGAKSAVGIDIDEVSVRVANENAALNGVEKKCRFSTNSLGDMINGSYGIVFANIVADVIIEYVHHIISNLGDYGIFIASGIIDSREQDVLDALNAAGLCVVERETQGGWVAVACQRMRI